jgi:hypothetical protein
MASKSFLSILGLFVLFTSVLVASVDASSVVWSQTYGGEDWDSLEAVIQTSDGGYALAGRTKSFGSGVYEFWVIKTDSLGNVQWNKTYGAGSAVSIVQTSDGGYVIGGSKLVKTDSGGNVEWEKNYEANSMVQTSDRGYALVDGEFWLTKTDALGNLQWERNHDGLEMESAQWIIQTSDSGYAIAGITRPGVGEGDFLLIKTDLSGEMEWSRTYGSPDKDEGHVVVQTSDGGYILSGLMWNRSGGDAGVIKTDSEGIMEWKQNYGEGIAWAMALTNDGGYVIVCNRIIKIDSEGSIQWSQPCPYGSVRCVIQTSDDGYALVGEHIIVSENDLSDIDAWFIKTDLKGNIPEFPSFTLMLVALSVVAVAGAIYKKKLKA